MKKPFIVSALVALAVLATVGVRASQRVRTIDIDGTTNSPLVSSARPVTNLTTTTTITNTVTGLTLIRSNLTKSITFASSDAGGTNIYSTLSVVTNVLIGVAVTNVQGIAVGTGFATIDQANSVISNNVLLYQLLQPVQQ